MSAAPPTVRPATAQAGFGVVEAMLVLGLNLFLLAGCLALCVRARDLQRTQDAEARLHESARLALAVLESDLRLAGFWGLAASAAQLTPNPLLAFPDRCGGKPWITSTSTFVDGANNRYLDLTNCAAAGGGAAAGADVLVIRRASARRLPQTGDAVAAADRERILVASRLDAGEVFLPGTLGDRVPPGYDYTPVAAAAPAAELRALLVHAYYVSVDSSLARGYPALRRKTLTSGPAIGDEEIAAGIEDLQFRVHFDTDGDGMADVTTEPGAGPDGATAVGVQFWLRLRSQERDPALGSTAAAAYADRVWPAAGDGFRRLLVTRTVLLRNGDS